MKENTRKCAVTYNNKNFEETYSAFKKIIIDLHEEEPTGSFFDKIIDAMIESPSKKFMTYKIDAHELYDEIYNITDLARNRLIKLLNNKELFMELLNEMHDLNIRCDTK